MNIHDQRATRASAFAGRDFPSRSGRNTASRNTETLLHVSKKAFGKGSTPKTNRKTSLRRNSIPTKTTRKRGGRRCLFQCPSVAFFLFPSKIQNQKSPIIIQTPSPPSAPESTPLLIQNPTSNIQNLQLSPPPRRRMPSRSRFLMISPPFCLLRINTNDRLSGLAPARRKCSPAWE